MSKRIPVVLGLVLLLPAVLGSPALPWNTFLGGIFEDSAAASAVDGSGNVFVVGTSGATWEGPIVRPYAGYGDAFVAKLNAGGALQWVTFLGGSSDDQGHAIGLDAAGNIYVAGTSGGTWGSPVAAFGGTDDAFVAKLSGGGVLQWNTFLGTKAFGFALALSGAGVYAAGTSYSSWGTPILPYTGNGDAFVASLSASTGALAWNTFLGGSGYDVGRGLAADSAGAVFIAGESAATWGAPVLPYNGYGAGDAFAAKLDASGVLQWNTFIGSASFDSGRAVALDAGGNVYVSGESAAAWGTPVRGFSGDHDAFAAMLSGAGALQWNTFLGGTALDEGAAIVADGGSLFVAGRSEDTWGTPGRSYSGAGDAFVARLDGSGSLQAHIFLGGTGSDTIYGLSALGGGTVIASGASDASWGAPLRPLIEGRTDAFIAKAVVDTAFTPAIAITSPNGGEVWEAGSKREVAWTTEGAVGDVKIEYSIDGGANYTEIVASVANSGTYLWTVPTAPSSNSLVRVSQASGGTPSDVSDAAFTIRTAEPPSIRLSRTSLNIGMSGSYGYMTGGQTVTISNAGGGTLDWTATASASWLRVSPASGRGEGAVVIGYDTYNYPYVSPGSYVATVTISDPNASNNPRKVLVNLKVGSSGYYSGPPPFGEFATPVDGATAVSGAIPVTGWALDDVDVEQVLIYRDAVAGDPPEKVRYDGRIQIGQAVFVEDARPDLEQAYPDYPLNYRGGWGYMLLTNALPGGGNGTFRLSADVMDREWNTVTLGYKTITCDNAHATKPFGTIDTPAQGGTASGNLFLNYGWVLAPQPNEVPKDGSTISVWVDGVNVGHPLYNLYRSDVATTFPGLKNTDGPVGYAVLDTTAYANGTHMIWWVAYDGAENGEGIGSRFFNILNSGASPERSRSYGNLDDLMRLPRSLGSVRFTTGFDLKAEPRPLLPDAIGDYRISIPEVGRMELALDSGGGPLGLRRGLSRYSGYLVVGDELRRLPIGSTLDPLTGRFSWVPGPAFLGDYGFIFVQETKAGKMKIPVIVTIKPKR
jgi:hypothetical protein